MDHPKQDRMLRQIKIIDSQEFEEYVDEYLQKCFPKKFVPKSNR